MTREIVIINAGDRELVGTMHRPPSGANGHNGKPYVPGVLMLNAGPAPRAGNSDLSAHLCDHLARHGVPAFRFDMPGLGDSGGEAPELIATFWNQVLDGRNDQPTLDVLAALRERFGIERFVLGGLCAGAVTSLRVADVDRRDVAGLILLEPNVRLEGEIDPKDEAAAMAHPHWNTARKHIARTFSLRSWLYFLTGESLVARLLRPIRRWLLEVLATRVGHSLPKDANVRLALTWHRVMRRNIPTLVLTAADRIEDRYCQRILESIPARDSRSVSMIGVTSTNHIFTAGTARQQLLSAVNAWMKAVFMLEHGEHSTQGPPNR